MNDDKTNLTNEVEALDWRSTSSVTDEQIEKYSRDILDSPYVSQSDGEYYSKDQLLGMFRLGIATVTDMEMWKKFVDAENKKEHRAYHVLRKMQVGDTVTFPYSAWNAARSAASKLKKDFGCKFTVRKHGEYNGEGTIHVLRCQ